MGPKTRSLVPGTDTGTGPIPPVTVFRVKTYSGGVLARALPEGLRYLSTWAWLSADIVYARWPPAIALKMTKSSASEASVSKKVSRKVDIRPVAIGMASRLDVVP